jgi:sec-independent protein translocase protein TatA
MGSMSIWHWILVIGVVLLLFGRGKITELMGDVAQGIKAFKKGMAEEDKPEVQKAESSKTIEHQPDTVSSDLKRRAAAETKIEGGTA